MEVAITDTSRRWKPFQRRLFTATIPERWSDVPARQAMEWLSRCIALEPDAARLWAIKKCLACVPKAIKKQIDNETMVAMMGLLTWYHLEPDCSHIIIPEFEYKGVKYAFPKPKGANIACIELPIGNDYYEAYLNKQDDESLLMLTATICRPLIADITTALARGDRRIPLLSRDEITARAASLQGLPIAYQIQALLYFSGFKEYVHNLYGAWLFEDDEEEEEEDGKAEKPAPKGPNFGWWGIFQSVAEGGVFGNLKQVYQSSIHDVCIYLVRKRQEADQLNQSPIVTKKEEDDDL